MASSITAPADAAAPATSDERWTGYSATVLTICILGWAFDIYEATIMQLVTPILFKEWGITPATMGTVTTISRWVGLIGTFAFPVLADLYGRKPVLIWSILGYSLLTGLTGFSTGWVTLLIFSSLTRIALAGETVAPLAALSSTLLVVLPLLGSCDGLLCAGSSSSRPFDVPLFRAIRVPRHDVSAQRCGGPRGELERRAVVSYHRRL